MPKSLRPSHLTRAPVKRTRTMVGVVLKNGTVKPKLRALNPKEVEVLHYSTNKAVFQKISDLTEDKRRQFFQLRGAEGFEDLDTSMSVDNVLAGNVEANISNAGGELEDQIRDDMNQNKHKDTRSRAERTQRRVLGFRGQQKATTDAYMKWGSTQAEYGRKEDTVPGPGAAPPSVEEVDGHYAIKVVDMFDAYVMHVPLHKSDKYVVSSLVGQGLFPCSPFAPTLAFTNRVLEFFCVAHLRSPSLSIQSWIKSLCDLHGTPYTPYLSQQFSICFDLYLETLREVDQRVAKALGRDTPDWRLKNCCPSCTYKLEGEQQLIFSMLTAADGNNSLKRVLQRDRKFDEAGNPSRGKSEKDDPRTSWDGGDYFLSREKVDQWSKEMLSGLVDVPTSDNPEEKSACEERWKNLNEELTSRMWGVFDETGVFLALCRHGFVLLLADMVKSGELAKYPLAMVNALLDAFGDDLGFGYDIGCGFAKTVKTSPLEEKATRLNLKCLVGVFHGHAHNRLCQLEYLATYVDGLGIEDLEGCERFFSQSNALSRSTRYASVFHRRQLIASYLQHTDTFDTYANLGTFLVNNYKQALALINGEEALWKAMDDMGVNDIAEFEERLEEERVYLTELGKEPEEETEQMEYVQRLEKLSEKRILLKDRCGRNSTSSQTVQRHARESYDSALKDVQASERKMQILTRWTVGGVQWNEAMALVTTRRYRLCIDELETLVLKRMFELTKMNMSGTGYKMRRHIAKALQTRCHLTWDQVVNYTFLSEWDLLRDPEGNAEIRPWSTTAARLVLDTHFRIQRAREEIIRLNIEIRRLVTYIRDEKVFLDRASQQFKKTDPTLSFFIRRYQWKRGRFDQGHITCLTQMAFKLGKRFTGTLVPGTPIHAPAPTPTPMDLEEEVREEIQAAEFERLLAEEMSDPWEDVEDDEGDIAEDEAVARILETVLGVSGDGGNLEEVDE